MDFVCHLKKHDNPNTAGVYFLNTYAGFEDRKYTSRQDEVFNLTTFQNSIVAAGSTFKYKVRSKLAIIPENVHIQQIHETVETEKGTIVKDSGGTFLHFIKPSKQDSWGTVGPICARYQLFSNRTDQFIKRLISRKGHCRG